MKFEIYKDAQQQFRFRLKSRNGKIIAVSESYEKKKPALQTLNRMKRVFKETDVAVIEV